MNHVIILKLFCLIITVLAIILIVLYSKEIMLDIKDINKRGE